MPIAWIRKRWVGSVLTWGVGWIVLSLILPSLSGAPPAPGSSASESSASAATDPDSPPAGGGGQQADFDTLIELIQSTIAPDTWEEVGGEGAISGFPGGVYVDTSGVLQQLDPQLQGRLATVWRAARLQASCVEGDQDLSRPSPLRKVSLRRLLEHLQRLEHAGREPCVGRAFSGRAAARRPDAAGGRDR